MKRFVTLLFLFMNGLVLANAQDMIVLKDGSIIEAKVTEISAAEIKYKRFEHLDGPTIVVSADRVLSIRYENGMVEVINTSQGETSQPINTPASGQNNPNSRLNTIGLTLGYQGASAFGFTVNGTVSPANYTFFDFSLGLGFNSFAFNGRANFNAFVPFTTGGWYAGIGIGGGYNESLGGIIAGNITTGFIFFNWLNIAYTLQLGNFDGIINNNIAVGYSYRFMPAQTSEQQTQTTQAVKNNDDAERFSLDGKRVFAVSGIGIVGEGFGGGATLAFEKFKRQDNGKLIGKSLFITAKWINSTDGIMSRDDGTYGFNLFAGGIGALLKVPFTKHNRIIYNIGFSFEYLIYSVSGAIADHSGYNEYYGYYYSDIEYLSGSGSKLGLGLQTGFSFRIHPNISLDINGFAKVGFGSIGAESLNVRSSLSGVGTETYYYYYDNYYLPHAVGVELGITYTFPY